MIEPFIEQIGKLVEKYSFLFSKDSKISVSRNIDYLIIESDNDRLEMLVDNLAEKLYNSAYISPLTHVNFGLKDNGENFLCYYDEKLFVISFYILNEHFDYMYQLQIACIAQNLHLKWEDFWI